MAEEEELSPSEVRAQDEEDIIKILLKQIEATPRDIDEKWISEMCRQIIIRDRSYGGYSARNLKSGTVMSRDPLYYAFEAREFIYDIDPQEDKILSSGQGLLAMAVAKSWDESREVLREQLAKEQRKREEDVVVPEELTAKNGGNPRQYISQKIRLHEGAIIDHFLGLKRMVADARERYKDNTNSSKSATEKNITLDQCHRRTAASPGQDLCRRSACGEDLSRSDAGLCPSRFQGVGHGLPAQ